jgi:hypothetical protein
MYRVSYKNLNPRNAVEHSVQIYHIMHLLCLNDFSCLDASLFVAEIFTTGSGLGLLPCVKFIALETILFLWHEIVKCPYA